MSTPQTPEDAGRRLVDLAETMIQECDQWIHVAETRADISPPIDPEAFRLARARALEVKGRARRREMISRELLDSMFAAYEEGCRQK